MPSQSMSMSAFQNTAPVFWQTATVAVETSESVLYLPLEICEQLVTLASSSSAVGPPPELPLGTHCWLAPPLQDQISIFVPLAVWLLKASRHLVTPPMVTRSSPADVEVHFWLSAPLVLQVQISTWVPLALLLPVTSRHLPDIGLTSWLEVMAASAGRMRMTAAVTTTAPAVATDSTLRSLIVIELSEGRNGTRAPATG